MSNPKIEALKRLLARINTPEAATALKGSQREEYLKALDNVYGDKASRMKDMGFSPETYYHGTAGDFSKFDDAMLGSVTGKGKTKTQHWFSDNPEVADVFSSQAAFKPLVDKSNAMRSSDIAKTLPEKSMDHWLFYHKDEISDMVNNGKLTSEQASFINKFKDLNKQMRTASKEDSLGQIMPVHLKKVNPSTVDAKGDSWSKLHKNLPEGELDIKNIKEGYGEVPMGSSYGVTDPSQIRSKQAAFDPRFKDSDNIMAATVAMPGVLGSGDEGSDKSNTLKEALKNAASGVADKVGEGFNWTMDKLDRPGRATRAAIGALQEDKDVLPAMRAQLGSKPPSTSSGADLAERFGEKYDIENPMALAALATAADLVDPTMMVPGVGQLSKVGKLGTLAKMAKSSKKGGTAADIFKRSSPDGLSKTIVRPSAQDIAEEAIKKNPGKVKILDDAPGRGQTVSKETAESVGNLPDKQVNRSLEELFGSKEASDISSQFPQVGSVDDKKVVLQRLLDEDKKLNPLGIKQVEAKEFSDAINKAKEVNPNVKPFVSDYPVDDLSKFKNYLSPDKKSGFAIKPDGDSINLFSTQKGRGEELMDQAILGGGKKLDHFDQPRLNELYSSKGFSEADRMKFADEYAPEGWDFSKLGRPDVIMRNLSPEAKQALIKKKLK